jgi:hypothetical protein
MYLPNRGLRSLAGQNSVFSTVYSACSISMMLLLFKSLSRSHILVQSFLESVATDKEYRCEPDKIWRLTNTGFAGRFFRISHRFRLLKTIWKSQFNEHLEVLEHEFVPLKGASVFTQLFGPRVFVWMSGLSKNSRINVSICT